jgi:hypothetical protein
MAQGAVISIGSRAVVGVRLAGRVSIGRPWCQLRLVSRSSPSPSPAAVVPVNQSWWIVAADMSTQSPRIVTPARQGVIDVAPDVGQQFTIDATASRIQRLKHKICAMLDTATIGLLGVLLI